MNRLLLLSLAVLTTLVLVGPASAQVPASMSYQGILSDPLGNPIPDGNYSLTVRLYAASAGGAALYSEVHNPVAVLKGGFNMLIGSVTPLSVVFDKPLWLSIQVGADPEMAPRVALASSPYALGLSLPFDGHANGTAPAAMFRNSTGAALAAEGAFQLFTPATGTPIASIQAFGSNGGQLLVKDEAGNNTARLEPDANGTGGFFTVFRNTISPGFSVNGNNGSGEPIVTVSGSARSSVFDMSLAGDASVVLPANAISAAEVLDEPGVAEIFANSAIQITLAITVMASRTITVPADGFVIAIGGGHIELGHVTATDSRILYGVNDVNNAFATSNWVAGVPSGAPSGTYRIPVPFTGVWPVTAGAHTFYLLAQRIGAANGGVFNDPTLALLYVPTSYGTVTGNKVSGHLASGPSSGVRQAAALSDSDIESERREAAAFDRARLQRELDAVQAQLASIQQRLSKDPQEAAAAVSAAQK